MDNDEEDEHSVQQMDKRSDINVISDRMARTYSHRRHLINSGAKLTDVLQMYPALKDVAQVFCVTMTFASQCEPFNANHDEKN